MRSLLISILLVLLASCQINTTDWQTLDFRTFQLKTPAGWTEIKRQGIDSYIGALTNGKDTLSFDYGWYSPAIGSEDPKKHKFESATVDSLPAKFVIPIKPGDGYIRMFIPVTKENKFAITGLNIQSTDTILKIFKSIIFKDGSR